MTINDQWELNKCRDILWDDIAKEKNELNILRQELKDYEAVRTLELWELKSEDGKKMYTVWQTEATIIQETKEQKTDINSKLFLIDKLEWKKDAIANYVINIRDYLKIIPTTQE